MNNEIDSSATSLIFADNVQKMKLGGTTTINRGKNIIRRFVDQDSLGLQLDTPFVSSTDGVNSLEAQNNEWHDEDGAALTDVSYIEARVESASDASSPKAALILSCTPSRALPGPESLVADEQASATDGNATQNLRWATSIGHPHPLPLRSQVRLDLAVGSGAPQRVVAAVFDVTGRRVRDLVDDVTDPGVYHLEWNGRTQSGAQVGAGVYFVRVAVGELTRTRKVVVVR